MIILDDDSAEKVASCAYVEKRCVPAIFPTSQVRNFAMSPFEPLDRAPKKNIQRFKMLFVLDNFFFVSRVESTAVGNDWLVKVGS